MDKIDETIQGFINAYLEIHKQEYWADFKKANKNVSKKDFNEFWEFYKEEIRKNING